MRKTVYYKDLLHDDFSSTNGKINAEKITDDFPYERSKTWLFFSGLLYYVIVLPIVFLIMKLRYGLRVRNRKAVSRLKSGAFLFGNHTNGFPDAVIPEEPAEENAEEEAGEASAEEEVPEEAGDIKNTTEEKLPEDEENDLP